MVVGLQASLHSVGVSAGFWHTTMTGSCDVRSFRAGAAGIKPFCRSGRHGSFQATGVFNFPYEDAKQEKHETDEQADIFNKERFADKYEEKGKRNFYQCQSQKER